MSSAPSESKTGIAAGAGGANHIISLESLDQWTTLLANHPKICLDAYTTWCGPCKKLAVFLNTISQHKLYQNVCFVKCDIEKVSELADLYSIASVPSVLFFQNGKQHNKTIVGFNEKQIATQLSDFKDS